MPTRTAADAYELAHEAKRDIESHEELCAQRYDTIHDTIGEIKSWVKAGVFGIAGVAITLLGFLGHEAYANLQHPTPPAQVGSR